MEQLVGIIISIVILSLIFIFIIVYQKYSKFVIKNSERIQKLLKLNDTISFNVIDKKRYYFYQKCNTKRQLDKLSLYEYFIALIESDFDYFTKIYEPINENHQKYQNYLTKCSNIKTEATDEKCKQLKTSLKKFITREDKLFKKNQISPTLNINIEVKATYTSPAGRNSYSKTVNYNFSEFKSIYFYTINLIRQKNTRQYQIKLERAKLSDSLRYDVLKRDNFQCQICGSSAQDGVKLHVDHIVPVSKGGKTILSNLRTLCDRCNMGKSDKLE